MKRSLHFLVLIVLITVSPLFSQGWELDLRSNVEIRTWKLTTKAEESLKPLGGASIKLMRGSTVVKQTTSDGNGDFIIQVPANGDFILEVSYAGCNTKRASVNTMNVPDFGEEIFKPTFGIGGFIMSKPFPGIDYTGLQQALVKVAYVPRVKNFDDDEAYTQQSLGSVSKIAEAEKILMERFCSTNKSGDEAMKKPDCPLAKTLYEKAMTIIPGEAYPVQQLVKVGECLKEKELAAQKAKEEAAKAEAEKLAKQKAEEEKALKAKEEAEKAAAEKLTQEKAKAEADKLAKQKDEEQKIQKAKDDAAKAEAAKIAKQKAEEEKALKAKEEAEKAAAEKLAQEKAKAEADKLAKQKDEEQKIQKAKEEAAKAEAEKLAKIAKDAELKAQKEKELVTKTEADKLAKQKDEEQKIQKAKDDAAKAEAAKIAKAAKETETKTQKEKELAAKAEAEKLAKNKTPAQAEPPKTVATATTSATPKKNNGITVISTGTPKESNTKVKSGSANYAVRQELGSGKYNDAIHKGDNLMANKHYAEAKTAYQEALKLKPKDEYATSRLNEVEKLMKQ
ncbi:MAG: hypothetical protein K0S33_456 [Bacteroidetes bacterium]|jgi:hypothetical protein|nr:hypothetical protein [Bacteroidota bacterium]